MARKDPYRNFRFRVEIDGIQQAGFSEVSGFESSIEAVEYREGTDPIHMRKLSGLNKFGNITLKWGITDSLEVYEWFAAGTEGPVLVKNLSIIAVDEAGNDTARWNVVGAWPVSYKAPDFDAKSNEVAIESLELVHEGIKRVG